jgi:hypothetical protein
MQETWDVSALIDKGTRIHEARGMTMQHLGMELRHIADRAFIDFITPAQRAWFRRCIAKVIAGEELGIISADLITGAVAAQPFFMTARPAQAPGKWWLMLTGNLPEALREAVRKPEAPALASGREFMLLVESAAQQAGERLDLIWIKAGILKNESAASPETRADLTTAFDRILLGDAYDGIASRASVSEYLLLRDREAPAGGLLAKLGSVAESHAIPASQLGLESKALQLSTLGPSLSPAGIRHAAATLRHGDGPAPEWEGVVMQQPLWLRPSVLALGSVAVLAILWFAT